MAAIELNDLLVTHAEPRVVVMTLNRSRARNALSLAMMHKIRLTLNGLGTDNDVAAIVLAADGPVFCSGHDLKEMTGHRTDDDGGRAFFDATMQACSDMMQSIVHCPVPVIAAVSGMATAAGCQLVASCDLAVASETATFMTPGVNIGLFCSTPMVALSRNLPRKKAMEMLLLGETMSAQDAAQYGLINRAVAAEDVMEAALAMARRIASKSRPTVAVGKTTFYRQIERPLSEAYVFATRVMVENMMADDAKEGICAFLEKRSPDWTS